MDKEIKLKRATEADIPNILEIDKSVIGTKLYHGLTGSKNRMKDFSENTFYLMKLGEENVGYIAYEKKEGNRVYIRWVALKKEFQGQGIAKKALQTLIGQLKDVKIIDLVTHPENEKAIALYKSLGFQQDGEQMENYFGDGEPKIKMVYENYRISR